MADKDNRTIIDLPLLSCHFIDVPSDGIDCSLSNDSFCIKCKVPGRFFAGGGLNDFDSPGHKVCLTEWVFTILFGLSGTLTNCLIITIIKRQNSKRAFDTFLLLLAGFDLIGSITSIIGSSAAVGIFENWDRGQTGQYMVYFGTFSCYFARSGSSLLTVMITLERYLAIAFPIRSSIYFTEIKTRIFCIIFCLTASFLALPRFSSFTIKENMFPRDIPSLEGLDHIIMGTSHGKFWYGTLKGSVSIIDFWVPLPLLLILNVLIFIEIQNFTNKRKQMSVKFKKEINAVKMFLPVVIFLFICNIVGYCHWYLITFKKIVYREIFLGLFLSVSLNSLVNFFFYMRSESFRNEFKKLWPDCLCCKKCVSSTKNMVVDTLTLSEKKTQDTQESDPV